MNQNILYENNAILVYHKPAGMPVQSGRIGQKDLVSQIKGYLAQETKTPYVGLVHRLDQPVEGLLVIAKTKQAAASLSRQITEGTMKKVYYAFVYGTPNPMESELVDYMEKEPGSQVGRIISKEYVEAHRNNPNVKEARLLYQVLPNRYRGRNDCSLVRIHLQTGRFHQIRLQMSNIGHPILADRKYGTEASVKIAEELGISSVALCAYELDFKEPVTGKDMCFQLAGELLPAYMKELGV